MYSARYELETKIYIKLFFINFCDNLNFYVKMFYSENITIEHFNEYLWSLNIRFLVTKFSNELRGHFKNGHVGELK